MDVELLSQGQLMRIKASPSIVMVDDIAPVEKLVDVERAKRLEEEYAKAIKLYSRKYALHPTHKFIIGKEHQGRCVLCSVPWSEHFHTLRDVEKSFAQTEGKNWKRLSFQQRRHYHVMASQWLDERKTNQ